MRDVVLLILIFDGVTVRTGNSCIQLTYFGPGGEGTALYKPYRYVPPHRVAVFALFWSENGYTICPFWSGIEYGFRGNFGNVRTFLSFQFQMSKKESEICEF